MFGAGASGAADSCTVFGCRHQCSLPACIQLLWERIRIRGFYPSSAFSLQRLDDSGKCCKMDGIFELLSNRLIFE